MRLPQFRSIGVAEAPQRSTAVVQTDFVRKARPWKGVDFDYVVEKLHQFMGPGANIPDRRGWFHRCEVIANMMDAASRRTDDVVEPVEVAAEQRFRAARIRLETAVRHRLAAAGLIGWIYDVEIEPLQQLQGRDSNLRKESIDKAGNEKSYFHDSAPSAGTRAADERVMRRCATRSTRSATDR